MGGDGRQQMPETKSKGDAKYDEMSGVFSPLIWFSAVVQQQQNSASVQDTLVWIVPEE